MRRCIILGAGGHARVVGAAAMALPDHEVVGFLDRTSENKGERICGAPVLGAFDDLAALARDGVSDVLLALGDNSERKKLFEDAKIMGLRLPALCHVSAVIEPTARLGQGIYVGALAYVGVEASIGDGAIINTRASLDHESTLGAFTSLAPGVTVAGRSHIGNGAFLGISASVADKVTIGEAVEIGAGAVVLSDIPAGSRAFGIPARIHTD